MAGIGHDGDILNVRQANSGGFLRLLTTGSMVDTSPSDTPAATARGYISLVADGAIGSIGQAFTINAASDSVLLLQAGQSAYIEQLVGDLTVQRALVGGDLDLRMASDLKIGDIDAGAAVILNVGGDVVDFSSDDSDPSADITATSLMLNVTGDFGKMGERIEINLGTVIDGSVDGDLFIHDFGIITLGRDLTITGEADILSENSMQGSANGKLSANGITLRSKLGDIGIIDPLQRFDILLTSGGLLTASAVNNILLSSGAAIAVQR
jgi:hypothetical protein